MITKDLKHSKTFATFTKPKQPTMQTTLHRFFAILAFCLSLQVSAQNPEPELFQTWYLSFIQGTDLSPGYNIAAVTPTIAPTLTINQNLEFTGNGACNGFGGVFSTLSGALWDSEVLFQTLLACDSDLHANVEGTYFNFMHSMGQYQIMPNANGLTLILYTPLFGQAVFQNYPLSTTPFDLKSVAIYPNPVSTTFSVDAPQLDISEIAVCNTVGQQVQNISQGFDKVDVSNLASGIYLLKINTSQGIVVRKIIKN